MNRKTILIVIVLSIGIVFRMYTGIYIHNEFGDAHFFVKHRPIWKWKFRSPIGMSDLKLSDLNEKEKKEELYFEEFITNQGLSR
jgi:hypothetical protein